MIRLFAALLLSWLLAGCTIAFDEDTCRLDEDCPEDQVCDQAFGYCVPFDPGADAGEDVDGGPPVIIQPLPGQAGAGCEVDDDCDDEACIDEDESNGVVPGGLCVYECEADLDCDEGFACRSVADGLRTCLQVCNYEDETPQCREDWACQSDPEGGFGLCLPACWALRCSDQLGCDPLSGRCRTPTQGCPYPCAPDEQCTGGRCIRNDLACLHAYNCPPALPLCLDGQCVPTPEGTSCTPATEEARCTEALVCIEDPFGPGTQPVCRVPCEDSFQCNIFQACEGQEEPACATQICGPQIDRTPLLGNCERGDGAAGTCLPFFEENGIRFGVCVEGGDAAEGAPCQTWTLERSELPSELLCEAGTVCLGHDLLNPNVPRIPLPGLGTCYAVCRPGAPVGCGRGRVCMPTLAERLQGDSAGAVSSLYDQRDLGVCVEERRLCPLDGSSPCPGDEVCQGVSYLADFGLCGPPGPVEAGFQCEQHGDCQEGNLCIGGLLKPTCTPLCSPNGTCDVGGACVLGPSIGIALDLCVDDQR